MLLRSSSTPVLGSLILSVADSPNSNLVEVNCSTKRLPSPLQNHHKVSFHLTGGSHNLGSVSCNLSPISPAPSERPGHDGMKGILRRAQSAGNLEGLGSGSCDNFDEFYSPQQKVSTGRLKSSVLETIPSFSFHNCQDRSDDEYGDSDDEYEIESQQFEEQKKLFDNSFGGEERGMATMAGEFASQKGNLELVDDKEGMTGDLSYEEKMEIASKEMYLALGIGINGGGMSSFTGHGRGNIGAGDLCSPDSSKDNNNEIEEHYKKMVSENPESALTLSNYAQFLYQSKRDMRGAEEYFSRAILIDPNDGKILAQYGKLIWELYRDEDRALSYFDRAVQAASEESHVHAAYASFLWETEEEENVENDAAENRGAMVSNFKQPWASVGA